MTKAKGQRLFIEQIEEIDKIDKIEETEGLVIFFCLWKRRKRLGSRDWSFGECWMPL